MSSTASSSDEESSILVSSPDLAVTLITLTLSPSPSPNSSPNYISEVAREIHIQESKLTRSRQTNTSTTPRSAILSPRPVRRVSFAALARLAACFDGEGGGDGGSKDGERGKKRESLMEGSTADRSRRVVVGDLGAVGEKRSGFGVIGGERKGGQR
ncbi:unnamed protein product [Diplocarpon coronariae]|uniref:Uncharacterized protein n=1 Tax=Diplocarpon coronariae TaxID=2795749 RepID=A0A218YVG5_9HELO|nr:hypothetical protein B2J93_8199 [Marssonina coronariae]